MGKLEFSNAAAMMMMMIMSRAKIFYRVDVDARLSIGKTY